MTDLSFAELVTRERMAEADRLAGPEAPVRAAPCP